VVIIIIIIIMIIIKSYYGAPPTGAQERVTTQITIKRSIKYLKMKKSVVIISGIYTVSGKK